MEVKSNMNSNLSCKNIVILLSNRVCTGPGGGVLMVTLFWQSLKKNPVSLCNEKEMHHTSMDPTHTSEYRDQNTWVVHACTCRREDGVEQRGAF